MGKVTITVSFTVDPTANRDIVRWLEGLPKGHKSAAIRAAIRDHLGRAGLTLGDVYQAIKDLDRKLCTGAVVTAAPAPDPDDWDEPPEAAAALAALAEL